MSEVPEEDKKRRDFISELLERDWDRRVDKIHKTKKIETEDIVPTLLTMSVFRIRELRKKMKMIRETMGTMGTIRETMGTKDPLQKTSSIFTDLRLYIVLTIVNIINIICNVR